MRWGFVLLFAASACERVWNFQPLVKQDARPIDAPDAPPMGCRTYALTLVADAFVDATYPTAPRGALDGIRIAPKDVGLFAFSFVGTGYDPAFEYVDDFVMTLHSLNHPGSNQAKACEHTATDQTCAPCTTTFDLLTMHWLTTHWTETEVTYLEASAGVTWSGPGATGTADRSDAITSIGLGSDPWVLHASHADIARVDPEPFLGPTTIAVELEVGTGVASIAARMSGGCIGTPPPAATAEVTTCAR